MRRGSEGQLQAELDLARICESASNCGARSDARARRVKESDTLRKRSGPGKIRAVEQIESLRTKLEAFAFRQRDVFHDRKIEVCQAGSNDGVAPQVAIKSCFRQFKGAGIEVEIGSSQLRSGGDAWTALGDAFHGVVAKARKQIRSIGNLGSACSVARTIKPGQDAIRRAVGQGEDAVDLPARKHFSSSSGPIPREGKVVGEVHGEVVADINAGQSPVGPPIVRVLWHGSAHIEISAEYAVRVVGVLGIRVRALQLESAAEAPVEAELQRVILGTAVWSNPELELPDVGIPARRVRSKVFAPVPDFRGQSVISVVAVQLVIGTGPGISHGDRGLCCDLLLDAEAVPDLRGVFHIELQPVT